MENYISNFSFFIGFVSICIPLYDLFKNRKTDYTKFWFILSVITLTVSNVIEDSWRTFPVLIIFALLYYSVFVYKFIKILIFDTSGSNIGLFNSKEDRGELINFLRPHLGDKKFIFVQSDGFSVHTSKVTLKDIETIKFIDSGTDYIQDGIDWVRKQTYPNSEIYILTDGYININGKQFLDFDGMNNDVTILKTVDDDVIPKTNKKDVKVVNHVYYYNR